MDETMPRTTICNALGNVYIAATTGIHTHQFATRLDITTRLMKPLRIVSRVFAKEKSQPSQTKKRALSGDTTNAIQMNWSTNVLHRSVRISHPSPKREHCNP
jgi:hypothetical protein